MSYGLQFGLICILVILGCAKVTLQGAVSRGYVRNTADSVLFNAQLFVVIALVILLLFPAGKIGWGGILMAALTAVFTMLFQTFYALALKSGPVSLTVLIGNFSLFVTTTFSVVTYRESVYLTQLLGIAFLLLSMLLSVKKGKEEHGISKKWLLLVLVMTLSNSAAQVVMKIFAKEMSAAYENSQNTFMVLAYAIAACLAFAFYLFIAHTGRREVNTYGFFNPRVLLYVLLIGTVLGVYQKLNMIGMERIDGGFLFPTFSGMQSLGMTVIGILLFKDKLSLRQIFGVICGIICVVLMNVRLLQLF